MIFSKQITEITYEDIVNFADEQITEGINLDYKRGFTADLAKTISAFANTHGGVIIIGIDDIDSKPQLPVTGVDFVEGLHERVVQICVEAMYPPVFPEIQVCPPVDNKTFVVIRIPESNETPHAINNRTNIYIRTGNITQLEDRATVDRIEWLLSKRKKSVELRNKIIDRCHSHFEDFMSELKNSGRVKRDFKLRSKITFSITPIHPYKVLMIPLDIKNNLRDWHIQNKNGYSFPRIDTVSAKPIQDGVSMFFYNERNGYVFYNEFNQFGVVFDIDDLVDSETKEENGQKTTTDLLYGSKITKKLHVFLKSCVEMYKKMGFWGLLRLHIQFEDLEGVTYMPYGLQFDFEAIQIISSPQPLSFETSMSTLTGEDTFNSFLIKVILDISWAFGHEPNNSVITNLITNN